jgi:hypothetical protein
MVSVLASCVVDHGFQLPSGQTKDYKIGSCCFSTWHASLRRKSKDWLARNQNIVSRVGRQSLQGIFDIERTFVSNRRFVRVVRKNPR